MKTPPRRELHITPAEIRLLRLLANGHCVESASAAAGVCYQTAKNHLEKARLRTGLNTYGLVAHVARLDEDEAWLEILNHST